MPRGTALHRRPCPRLLLALGLVAACGLFSSATAVTLPLPELTGGYEYAPGVDPDFGYPGLRTTTFAIPAEVRAIDTITLVVSGEWTMGEVTCYDGPEPESDPFISPMTLYLSTVSAPADFYRATVTVPDGPFTGLTAELEGCCGPDAPALDALLGQEINAEMVHEAGIIGICAVTLDPYGTFTDVHLEISGTVAVQSSSWSRIKGLYR